MLLVESNLAPLPFRENGRRHARKHLFVAASLVFDGTAIPVRVRNMSGCGALIEFSGRHPVKDQIIVLRRGPLEVAGTVAWIEGQRAGLAFDTLVDVGRWMARVGSVAQSQIDEIVASIRSDGQTERKLIRPDAASPLAHQLEEVRVNLARLADSLLDDDEVVTRHPQVQIFDVVLQKLDRLIRDHKA